MTIPAGCQDKLNEEATWARKARMLHIEEAGGRSSP